MTGRVARNHLSTMKGSIILTVQEWVKNGTPSGSRVTGCHSSGSSQ